MSLSRTRVRCPPFLPFNDIHHLHHISPVLPSLSLAYTFSVFLVTTGYYLVDSDQLTESPARTLSGTAFISLLGRTHQHPLCHHVTWTSLDSATYPVIYPVLLVAYSCCTASFYSRPTHALLLSIINANLYVHQPGRSSYPLLWLQILLPMDTYPPRMTLR